MSAEAVRKFGAAGTIREQYHAELSLPFIETLSQDLRYLALWRSQPAISSAPGHAGGPYCRDA